MPSPHTDFGDPGPIWPTSQGCPGISVHSWTKGSVKWKNSRLYHDKTSSEDLSESCLSISESADVTVFIAEHENLLKCCGFCQETLHDAFAFLPQWWEGPYILSNGYFGYKDDIDENGRSRDTWSRFLLQFLSSVPRETGGMINHQWRDIIPFTYWHRDSNRVRVLFLRTEESVVQRLLVRILNSLQTGLGNDPLWPYTSILEEVIRCQHDATIAVRDLIIDEEGRRQDWKKVQPQADYHRLHSVAKHATTVAEILDVNVKTLDGILDCHNIVGKDLGLDGTTKVSRRSLHQSLLFQSQIIFGIRARCISYKVRIRNEIQLAFNLVAQEDAKNSFDIATATRADSQAMTSNIIITLVFLPPTFISSIFSMSFFDFGNDSKSWTVSDNFYVYWVCVVPVTLIVGGILYRGHVQQSVSELGATSHQVARRLATVLSPDVEDTLPTDVSEISTKAGTLHKATFEVPFPRFNETSPVLHFMTVHSGAAIGGSALMWIAILLIVAYIGYKILSFSEKLGEEVAKSVRSELSGKFESMNKTILENIFESVFNGNEVVEAVTKDPTFQRKLRELGQEVERKL
ncbi:hypothetical protein BX600DRAFT_533651 [Xylariales sp. PMI_506]|nr:hypothetical protein BX600DRAFT_533651 [Xylariales sp. PMI_506]